MLTYVFLRHLSLFFYFISLLLLLVLLPVVRIYSYLIIIAIPDVMVINFPGSMYV